VSEGSKLDFFRRLAERWDGMVDPAGTRHTLERILAPWREDFAGAAVLEVGCGTGHLASFLLRLERPPRFLAALDFARPMLERCRRRAPEAAPVLGRAEVLPFRAGWADIVIGQGLFPHLDRPGLFLTDAYRLLRPGGWLILPHTSSREAINRVHREGEEPIRGDLLPAVSAAAATLAAHRFRPGPCRDDQFSWLVSGRR